MNRIVMVQNQHLIASLQIAVYDIDYIHSRYPHLSSLNYEDICKDPDLAWKIDPNPLFDVAHYRMQLEHDATLSSSPAEHYITNCGQECTSTSPLFRPDEYLALNRDLEGSGVDPLLHYLAHGFTEGRPFFLIPCDHLADAARSALSRDPLNIHARSILCCHYLDVRDYASVIAVSSTAGARALLCQLSTLVAVAALARHGEQEALLARLRAEAETDSDFLNHVIMSGNIHETIGRTDMAYAAYSIVAGSRAVAAGRYKRIAADWCQLWGDEPRPISPIQRVLAKVHRSLQSRIRPRRLAVIDNSYPSPQSAFRYGEISEILRAFPDAKAFSTIQELRDFHPDGETLESLKARALIDRNRNLRERVHDIGEIYREDFSAYYTIFLNNVAFFIKSNHRLKKKQFSFTLYPGGGFALSDQNSDDKLRRCLGDHRLSRVVTTQNLTLDYVSNRGFCDQSRILHIPGGIVPSAWSKSDDQAKKWNGKIHVCFVAQKYTADGAEKGCDTFAQVANALGDDPRFSFHFVGGWTPEITGTPASEAVHYHGIIDGAALPAFFDTMHIIVSPNVSLFELGAGRGSFDGFPTTAAVEAGLRGVVMMLTDSLNLNAMPDGGKFLCPGLEFDLIVRDVDVIVDKLDYFARCPEALLAMGRAGRDALRRRLSFDLQMRPRLEMLKELVDG